MDKQFRVIALCAQMGNFVVGILRLIIELNQ